MSESKLFTRFCAATGIVAAGLALSSCGLLRGAAREADDAARNPAAREAIERILGGSRTAAREGVENGGKVAQGIQEYRIGNKQTITGNTEDSVFSEVVTYTKDIAGPFAPGPDDIADGVECAIKIRAANGSEPQNSSKLYRASDGNWYFEYKIQQAPQLGEACAAIRSLLPQ